jgi:putative ABC transport system ATP-binding protein
LFVAAAVVAPLGATVVDSVCAGCALAASFDPPPHAATSAIPHSTTPRPVFIMLSAKDLTKEYLSGTSKLAVLKHVSFDVPQGAFVSIVGPSGSGKTTLLGLLAGLDAPSSGSVSLDGAELTRMSEDERALLRGEKVGFIFQTFQLIPTLTAIENVQVPLELRGETGAAERATALLNRVGLAGRMDHFPSQLSGGEQQRVAIARAFSNAPRILFADEPTGNLDGDTGAKIVELLEELNRESGSTVVIVTHDIALARRAMRMIRLKDGVVVEDTPRPDSMGG